MYKIASFPKCDNAYHLGAGQAGLAPRPCRHLALLLEAVVVEQRREAVSLTHPHRSETKYNIKF